MLVPNVRIYRRSQTLRNFKLGLSNLRSTTFHKSKKRNNNDFEMGGEISLRERQRKGKKMKEEY